MKFCHARDVLEDIRCLQTKISAQRLQQRLKQTKTNHHEEVPVIGSAEVLAEALPLDKFDDALADQLGGLLAEFLHKY